MSDGTTLNLDQSNNFSQTIALSKDQNHVNSYAAKKLVFDNTKKPNDQYTMYISPMKQKSKHKLLL